MKVLLGFVLCLTLAGSLFVPVSSSAAPSLIWPQLGIQPYISGLNHPINIANAGDGSGRLFVNEQRGTIRVIKNGVLLATPFLDIVSNVDHDFPDGGQGLLGLAFPPGYASKGHFYVDYVESDSNNIVIARYNVSANPDIADRNSAVRVLTIPPPAGSEWLHYGGQLAFGPDGYLYISVGDGGPENDPNNNAQNMLLLRGKLLRVDVEGGAPPYSIPPSNPFVGNPNVLPEIWASGLRNPWRFSFDRLNGNMFIGDVGQARYEEVDFQSAGSGGQNYGWRIMEAASCFSPPEDCVTTGLTYPATQYGHDNGDLAVTGGYVFRGPHSQPMQGKYIFGDFASGRIWGLVYDGGWQKAQLDDEPFSISSFGEDEAGNLYLADYSDGWLDIVAENTVDAWLQGASVVGGPPGGIAQASVDLGNDGLQTATSVQLTAYLDPSLGYAGASPAPTSTTSNTVTWNLSDLAFRATNHIILKLLLPSTPLGTRYPITWQMTNAGPEFNPGDNTLHTQVMISNQFYLPVVAR